MEEQNIEQLNKKERRESVERRQKTKSRFIWIGSLVVFVLAIILIIALPGKSQKERPGEILPILGREHIDIGASHIAYNSNPPTSGPHYAEPAKWGVYDHELADEQLVHNLEHGGIWISYTGISTSTKTQLEKLTQLYVKIIVEPRAKNDAPIVLVSWGRLQKFQSYDEQNILAFIKANTNQSPEPLAP